MSYEQMLELFEGDIITYDKNGCACKFDEESKKKLIEAVERMIPAKTRKITHLSGYYHNRCGHCGNDYLRGSYCSKCGYKIDYEVEE